MVGGKTGSFVFFTQYSFLSHFDLRHLEKTIKTLLSQSMVSKNPINRSKTRNSPEIKKNPKLRYVVLGVFKGKKKHLNVTSLIIWNFLTHKSIILVVVTFLNNHFFFLNRNLTTPSLSSQQKITKKKRKKS
jgi:hypothetical protein